MLIYKIFRPAEWEGFEASGVFDGSPDDKRDGFIHCSTADQAPSTAQRYFSGEPRLIIGVLDADKLEGAVRWEPASNRQLYPHIYRHLTREDLVAVHDVAGAGQIGGALSL